jgi:hypothetical protein
VQSFGAPPEEEKSPCRRREQSRSSCRDRSESRNTGAAHDFNPPVRMALASVPANVLPRNHPRLRLRPGFRGGWNTPPIAAITNEMTIAHIITDARQRSDRRHVEGHDGGVADWRALSEQVPSLPSFMLGAEMAFRLRRSAERRGALIVRLLPKRSRAYARVRPLGGTRGGQAPSVGPRIVCTGRSGRLTRTNKPHRSGPGFLNEVMRASGRQFTLKARRYWAKPAGHQCCISPGAGRTSARNSPPAPSSSGSEVTSTLGKRCSTSLSWKLPMAPGIRCRMS